MKQRKIAILLPCLLTGGTEVVTLDTLRIFVSLGFAVDVIVYFDEVDPIMRESFVTEGSNLILLGVRRDGGVPAQALLATALARQLLIGRYHLVWLQYMTPTLLPLLIARFFTPRLVACIHVAASHYSAAGIRRIRWMARHWLTRLVCVSHTVANGIFGEGWRNGVYSQKVLVIPNSIDTSTVDAASPRNWRDETGWAEGRIIVGYCGRLAAIKGVDILLEAVGELLSKGHDIGVVLVGDGEQRGLLESLGTRLGFGERLHFAGRVPREEIYAAIKGFDIAVVPSREEGFGLSAIEAMGCKVPLVTSNAGALPEITGDSENAMLFESGNIGDLVKVLMQALDNQEVRSEISAKAIQHVSTVYDRGNFSSAMKQLFSSLGIFEKEDR